MVLVNSTINAGRCDDHSEAFCKPTSELRSGCRVLAVPAPAGQ